MAPEPLALRWKDLLGVDDDADDLPDFMSWFGLSDEALAAHAAERGQTYLGPQLDRLGRDLQLFYKAVDAAGFTAFLVELAVIDERSLRATVRSPSDPTPLGVSGEFVSAFAAYYPFAEELIDAWQKAISRIVDSESIVGSASTYDHGLIVARVEPPQREKYSPKSSASQRSTSPIRSERYPFGRFTSEGRGRKPIEIAEELAHHLSEEMLSSEAGATMFEIAKEADIAIVVVPFRRPTLQATGLGQLRTDATERDIDSRSKTFLGDRAGGCLFLIVGVDREKETEYIEKELRRLALIMHELLLRAALLEANKRLRFARLEDIARWGHAMRRPHLVLRGRLSTALDLLGEGRELEARASIESSHRMSERLFSLLDQARSAYLAAYGHGEIRNFDERCTVDRCIELLRESLEEARVYAIADLAYSTQHSSSVDAPLRLKLAETVDFSWTYHQSTFQGHLYETSQDYLRLAASEVVSNAIRYGWFREKPKIWLEILEDRQANWSALVCRISNAIDSSDKQRVAFLRRIESGEESYLGLSQLEWLSRAWHLRLPKARLVAAAAAEEEEEASMEFVVEFDIARVR